MTFLGWLSDPFKGLSDLQLGDEKVTLNHLVPVLFFFTRRSGVVGPLLVPRFPGPTVWKTSFWDFPMNWKCSTLTTGIHGINVDPGHPSKTCRRRCSFEAEVYVVCR